MLEIHAFVKFNSNWIQFHHEDNEVISIKSKGFLFHEENTACAIFAYVLIKEIW